MAGLWSALTGRMTEEQRVAATAKLTAASESKIADLDRKILIKKDELQTLKLEAKAYKKKGKEVPDDLEMQIKNADYAIKTLTKSRSTIAGANGTLERVDLQITTTESIKQTTKLAHKLALQNKKTNTEDLVEQFHATEEILDETGGLFEEIAGHQRVGTADLDDILAGSDSDLSDNDDPIPVPPRRSTVPVSRVPVATPAPPRPRTREPPLET